MLLKEESDSVRGLDRGMHDVDPSFSSTELAWWRSCSAVLYEQGNVATVLCVAPPHSRGPQSCSFDACKRLTCGGGSRNATHNPPCHCTALHCTAPHSTTSFPSTEVGHYSTAVRSFLLPVSQL
ncbi:hypothetical protein BCV70DRAFT_14901 [Testicularia cyperi]|uniref:Uncharacterized protein n=1 Tax=Testicularia cyperi TaxID=1882483 RepID=A0A317XZC3_9BASI|nr:hypothetical protein BCV70DRAFT_14901 [Testicularia cyperi]